MEEKQTFILKVKWPHETEHKMLCYAGYKHSNVPADNDKKSSYRFQLFVSLIKKNNCTKQRVKYVYVDASYQNRSGSRTRISQQTHSLFT